VKRILSIVVVGILVLSGLGAVALASGNTQQKIVSVAFSQPVINEQNQYAVVSMDGTNSVLMRQNKPMLPSYIETFTFPFGTEIISVSCTPNNVYQQTISKNIMPTPVPVLAGDNVENTQGPTSYDIDPYPNTWFEYGVGSGLNGLDHCVFVKVNVFPVQYNPAENLVSWSDDVEIIIDYKEPTQPVQFSDQYTLVVLGPSEFSSKITPLITHKNSNGVTSKFVSLDEIYAGTYFPVQGRDNQEKIKYFVKDIIENWGTSYVLLVGSSIKFPVRETHVHIDGNPPDNELFVSDLYYADIYDQDSNFCSWDSNGNDIFGEYDWGTSHQTDQVDLYPDIYLGRLACVNTNEVTTVVNKIINYETSVAYAKDWFTNLVACGGDSFPGDDNSIDEGEYVNEAVIGIMDGFIPNKVWASNGRLSGTLPTGAQEISGAINAGAGFVDFSGHGNTNVWATHPHEDDSTWLPTPVGAYVNSPHVSGLTNGEKLPIVILGGCSCSKYNTDSDCISWAFVSNPNGGGIASLGATGLGWAYIGEGVTQGLIEAMSINTFKAYKQQGATTFGEMWAKTINKYISTGMEATDYKTVEEWQPFGDPSLAIASSSQPPAKPQRPSGPASGNIKTEYSYTSSTTDPEGDKVYYQFDWNDGTTSGWVGPYNSGEAATAKHAWTKKGSYEIKVKAKDEHGAQSGWSDPLPISMPRGRLSMPILQFMEKLLERFPHAFPILRELLNV
jgi:hypothetical protein